MRRLGLTLAACLLAAPLQAQPRLPAPGTGVDDAMVVGVLRPVGLVEDPVFGIAAPALGLWRQVEMYQWREVTVPGQAPRYETAWSESAIDSAAFAAPAGHQNPGALPFQSERWFAPEARLGDRPIGPAGLWQGLEGWQPLSPDPTALPPNLALLFIADGVGLSTSEDPLQPRIGDLRVRWSALPGGPVAAEVVESGEGYRPASEAAVVRRVPAVPEPMPGLAGGRHLASDLWIWVAGLLLFAVLIATVLVFRSRKTRSQ